MQNERRHYGPNGDRDQAPNAPSNPSTSTGLCPLPTAEEKADSDAACNATPLRLLAGIASYRLRD